MFVSCCCRCCWCCWNLQNLYRAFHLFIIPTSLARRCGGHARLLLHHVRVFCRLIWVFQLFRFGSHRRSRRHRCQVCLHSRLLSKRTLAHSHTAARERTASARQGDREREQESAQPRERSETTTTKTNSSERAKHTTTLGQQLLAGISALCCYFVYFLTVGVWRCRHVLTPRLWPQLQMGKKYSK